MALVPWKKTLSCIARDEQRCHYEARAYKKLTRLGQGQHPGTNDILAASQKGMQIKAK